MPRYKIDDYDGPTSAPIYDTLEKAQEEYKLLREFLEYIGSGRKVRIIELGEDYEPETHVSKF